MKIYTDIQQGTNEWFRLRLGLPTASCFDQIVTPKKCELSKSAPRYALRLVAERLLNMPTESVEGQMWMERGKELEPQAVRQYEFTNDLKTVPVGFITNDAGTLGCSPDRIVLDNERIGLEIKCPSPHIHLGYMLNGTDDDYKPQVQGQIMIAELHHADFYSFHPRMPPALIRTEPDADYIAKMTEALNSFADLLNILTERANKLGVYQAMEYAASPLEMSEAQSIAAQHQEEAYQRFSQHGFNH
jgi:hypothetical protein